MSSQKDSLLSRSVAHASLGSYAIGVQDLQVHTSTALNICSRPCLSSLSKLQIALAVPDVRERKL